jgi:integrase
VRAATPPPRIAGPMAELLYGIGMRVGECCTLGVRDIDLWRAQIIVRAGKRDRDRCIMVRRFARSAQGWDASHPRFVAKNAPPVGHPHAAAGFCPAAKTERSPVTEPQVPTAPVALLLLTGWTWSGKKRRGSDRLSPKAAKPRPPGAPAALSARPLPRRRA